VRWWRVSIVTVLMLSSALAINLYSHGRPIPPRHDLHTFSSVVGSWQGSEISIDPRIVDILKADQLLLREYTADNKPPLSFFVAYYQSQRQGATVHSPRHCLPGAGWEPVEAGHMVIQDQHGNPQIVNRYVVQKGVDRLLVLYWYQMHGRIVASEYEGKAFLVWDALRLNRTDGALVRVMVPITDRETGAEQVARDFIRQISPLLHEYIPD
jgi:EpsI family protein